MKTLSALFCCLALAACGVDGEPSKPDATLAVGVTPDGVKAGASVGVTRGPLRVGVTLF